MRRATVLVPLLLMAACGSRFAGQPTEKVYDYYRWEIEYKAAVTVLAAARRAGDIDDETYRYIDPIVQEGKSLLDQIHEQIDTQLRTLEPGAKIEVDADLVGGLLNVLDKLLLLKARYS